jgi:mevalonate pyrophosphate decarboxylase
MIPSATMREFAMAKTSALLDDLVSAMQLAAQGPDEEAVHKLRVSIRRFQQALRLFAQYFKSGGIEKIKGKLREIMGIAGELRNLDIATALTIDAGGNAILLSDRRADCDRQLASVLRPFVNPMLAHKWRRQLGLEGG